MRKTVIHILLLSLFIYPTLVRAEANPKPLEEISALNSAGVGVLDEISGLRQEMADLQSQAEALGKKMDEAKDHLKRISAASLPARRENRFLKKAEPEYAALMAKVQEKKTAFKQKEASLAIIESRMNLLEENNHVSDNLIEVVSRFVAPDSQS